MASRVFYIERNGEVSYDSAGAGGIASYGSPFKDGPDWGYFVYPSGDVFYDSNFSVYLDSYGHKNTGVKS